MRRLGGKKKKYIYVDAKSSSYVAYYLSRIFMAIGMQELLRKEIIINAEKIDDNLIRVSRKYNCQICVIRKNPIATFKAAIMSIYFILRKFSRKQIIDYKYKNIPVGGFLYDILVRNNNKRCTVENISLIDYQVLWWSFKEIISVYSVFKKKLPLVYLTNETGHLAGCTGAIAAYMGAYVFQCKENGRVHYLGHEKDMTIYLHDIFRIGFQEQWKMGVPKNYLEEVDKYLYDRVKGKTDPWSRYAYSDKKVLSRDKYIELFRADPNKKNVVIMCHCFSDTPHLSCRKKIYDDYYVWFVETLKIITRINNVNWIVKAHPSRSFYGESEEVEELFKKYDNFTNMYFWDDAYSTESLFDIADVVVTVAGTCGLEFPCYGIPVINTGSAFYDGFGCNMTFNSVEEYKNILKNLDKLDKLDEEHIVLAKRLLYTKIHMYEPFDEIDEILVRNSPNEDNFCDDPRNANEEIWSELDKREKEIMNSCFVNEGRKRAKEILENMV